MGKRAIMGDFEYAVIRAVHREFPRAYGVPIREMVAEMLGKKPDEVAVGAIYTTLDRLEEKGYVRSEESAVENVSGGRRKILYFVEAEGLRAMEVKGLSSSFPLNLQANQSGGGIL